MSARSTKKLPQDLAALKLVSSLGKDTDGESSALQSMKPEPSQADVMPEPVKTPEQIERDEFESMIQNHAMRMELLPLPFELLKKGLSEIGPAPDSLNSVYHKLSLPVLAIDIVPKLDRHFWIGSFPLLIHRRNSRKSNIGFVAIE
jgi:hypothetical protein